MDFNCWSPVRLGDHLERPVLHVRLHGGTSELPANQSLGIKDGVLGVHCHPGRGRLVALQDEGTKLKGKRDNTYFFAQHGRNHSRIHIETLCETKKQNGWHQKSNARFRRGGWYNL